MSAKACLPAKDAEDGLGPQGEQAGIDYVPPERARRASRVHDITGDRRGERPAHGETERVIDEVVSRLNEMHGHASLELSLAMGSLIVQRFYAGDLSRWRHHGPKEASFRRLAARCNLDLRVSASGLYRAVALYELTRRLGVSTKGWLSMTHLRCVLGLPAKDQAALLEMADREHWSTVTLELEAARVRQGGEHRSGRPRSPMLIKVVRKLVACCCSLEAAAADAPEEISRTDMQNVYETITSLNTQLERLSRRLLTLAQEDGAAPTDDLSPK